jgi:hypothetical protein
LLIENFSKEGKNVGRNGCPPVRRLETHALWFFSCYLWGAFSFYRRIEKLSRRIPLILSDLQKTLQEWLDGLAKFEIDISGMYDISAPRSTGQASAGTSTLFLLTGKASRLAQVRQLIRPLEALSLVSFWKEVRVPIIAEESYPLLLVILDIASDQWNFLHERNEQRKRQVRD